MNLPERTNAYDNAEPLAEVLARIHAELEDIARRIDHNQAMIAKATWTAGATDHDYVRAMQDADLNAQRIAGIADFLQAMSAKTQRHWQVDTTAATATLKLSELVRSIGNPSGHVQAKDEEDAGNVDLF